MGGEASAVNAIQNRVALPTAEQGGRLPGGETVQTEWQNMDMPQRIDLQTAEQRLQNATQEQNNTASTGETVNENGLDSYTDLERTNLSSGRKNRIISTFQDAVSLLGVRLRTNKTTDRAYFGKLPRTVSDAVFRNTGIDVCGYGAMMNGNDIWHIMKSHGNQATEAASGQVAITLDDIALIPEILSSSDSILPSKVRDGKGRNAIEFGKNFGDYYITIRGASDGKQVLQTDSLYKQRRTRTTRDTMPSTITDAVPVTNARSEPPQSSSNSNIPQNAQNVNTQANENVEGVRGVPVSPESTVGRGTTGSGVHGGGCGERL